MGGWWPFAAWLDYVLHKATGMLKSFETLEVEASEGDQFILNEPWADGRLTVRIGAASFDFLMKWSEPVTGFNWWEPISWPSWEDVLL